MDVFECIETRRTVRNYGAGDIPLEKLVQILDAGTDAPSAGNTQPWEFIIVTEQEVKDKLCEVSLRQSQLKEAPLLIVVLANKKTYSLKYGDRGKNFYCIQDTAACVQNMLLATHALGLGACWIGAFDEGGVRTALNISDDDILPVAILTIGNVIPYSGSVKPQRIDIDKKVWAEKYGEKVKWILPPQRKQRFKLEPMDQHLGKLKEKMDTTVSEISEKTRKPDEKEDVKEKKDIKDKEKKPIKKSFSDFFKKLTG